MIDCGCYLVKKYKLLIQLENYKYVEICNMHCLNYLAEFIIYC